MRDAFIAQLTKRAMEDKRIILITGDLGFGVLNDYIEKLPEQFLNAGVAEQNMTGLAAGLALEGRIVFTYSIGNFPTLRCLEQIRNDVCYHDLNVNIIAVGGGFSYGSLGMSHHATEDLSIMRALPNISVLAPSDPWQVADVVDAMIADQSPSYLRLDKGEAGVSKVSTPIEYGKISKVREGRDITIISVGSILSEAISAAAQLSKQGIEARLLDVHSLKPIDIAPIIAAARETGGIVTIEENNIIGGLAGVVSEVCIENGAAPKCFKRMGLQDTYSSVVGSQEYLRGHYKLTANDITGEILRLLS